jgi:hypothetical protein
MDENPPIFSFLCLCSLHREPRIFTLVSNHALFQFAEHAHVGLGVAVPFHPVKSLNLLTRQIINSTRS